MAANIGSVSCDYVRARVRGQKPRVELWQVPGMDGYGAQDFGLGDSDFVFLVVKYGTASAVDTWIGQLEALQGTIVSAEDDWGTDYADLLVVRVGPPQKTAEIGHGGCRGQARLMGVTV